jgi:hypothetical protein
MKRILLSLLLLITLTVQAQRTLVHTNKVTTGHWDEVAEDWLWGKEKYTVINFLMQGNTIIADDVAESTYTTLDLVVDEDNISMWNAIDENSVNCSFIINRTPPETISVMYSDVIYVYEIDYIE